MAYGTEAHTPRFLIDTLKPVTVKAKDHPAYRYELTNHAKLTKQAEQLKKYHDSKKGK